MPATAVPITIPEVLRATTGIFSQEAIKRFEKSLVEWLSVSSVVLVNNSSTAIYLILKALKNMRPDRNEVVYPAYAFPSHKLAFDRVGLKTKICDVSLKTFNMDPASLAEAVGSKTLAIVPAHMFGFPMELDEVFRIAGKEMAVIEDACQAAGARLKDKFVGSIAPSSIFSLCKGMNISTLSGGFAVFNDTELAQMVRAERDELPKQRGGVKLLLRLMAFALSMRPGVYGTFYPIVKRIESEDVNHHFDAVQYTHLQAALGEILIKKLDVINAQRRVNGMFLYEVLKDMNHILIPRMVEGGEPVFNHMPVVFLNEKDRQRAQARLREVGIETSRMYLRPNHHIFDLGYPRESFPQAALVAAGLVALPTHPFLTRRDLELMVKIVGEN